MVIAAISPELLPPPPPTLVLHLLRRTQAGDDLRLLEDGLAGELLQHRHDHQAGGGGPGRFPPLSCDLSDSRRGGASIDPVIFSIQTGQLPVCFDVGVLRL